MYLLAHRMLDSLGNSSFLDFATLVSLLHVSCGAASVLSQLRMCGSSLLSQ